MSLEKVISIGKKDRAVVDLENQFNQDQSIPVGIYLSKISGDEGLPEAEYLSATPAENRAGLNVDRARYQHDLIEAVQEDFGCVVNSLGTEDITNYLLNTSPIDKAGSKEIRESHAKAYDSMNAVKDPQKINEEFEKYLGNFESEGTALITRFIGRKNPELKNGLMFERARLANEEFGNVLGDGAGSYVSSMYENSGDDEKKSIAYTIGSIATEISN